MFNNILIPVDLAAESSWRRALPAAVEQTRHGAGALIVMTVSDLNLDITETIMSDDFTRKYQEKLEQRLDKLVKQHVPEDIPVRQFVRNGRIYREVLEAANDVNADLIVMASHRPSMEDYLLGTNAAKVMRHAKCSVLVVRER
jgi:nucleotide-binding universal stress UspA family protein